MPGELTAAELNAYFALRRAGDRLEQAVTRQLRDHGLTEIQFSVLASLAGAESGMGMTDLAGLLMVSKSGLSYQAEQLEKRGLVARAASTTDDRAVIIRIAPDGASLLKTVLPMHVTLVRELFLDRAEPGDLQVLTRVLSAVARD